MSLVRLLTAGKSLVGLAESTNRYRMRSGQLLPKFGSAKNPFAQSGESKAEPAPADAGGTTPARYQMPSAELSAARLKETKRLPAVIVAAMQEADSQMAEARMALSAQFKARAGEFADKAVRAPMAWTQKWLRKLNPLAWWAGRKSGPKPVISRFGKAAAVQGELSLDNIKVVRNDLNESDVELVLAKPVAPKKAAATEPPATTAELIKT